MNNLDHFSKIINQASESARSGLQNKAENEGSKAESKEKKGERSPIF